MELITTIRITSKSFFIIVKVTKVIGRKLRISTQVKCPLLAQAV